MATTGAPPEPAFEAAWTHSAGVAGWLTRDQARLLWDRARAVPAGSLVVEIGSHQGRSTIVLAHAARLAGARVVAIDPFVAGRMFGGAATRARFEANLAAAGVADVVELRVEYSTRLRSTWTDPIGALYVDGKHDYWTVTDDLRWAEHLPAGADVLVHDAFSSIGVTLGLLAHALPTRRLRLVGRAGSLAHFRVGRPGPRDRVRFVAQLPWFARNVVVKVLLRLRLGPVTRLLGHRSPVDPY